MTSAFGAIPRDERPRLMGAPVDHLPVRLPEARRGARRRITVVGEEILHRPCREVTEFDTDELASMIDDMFATMEIAHGVGLAANQAGFDWRVFVFDCVDDHDVRHVGHVVNPTIDDVVKDGARLVSDHEGCLSVPGPSARLDRPARARVHGFDQTGAPITLEGTGMLARCFQHEVDHLDGLLYVDHLSSRTRDDVLRDMESKKADVWAEWDERAERFGK